MDRKKLAEALQRIMPGYNWTVHQTGKGYQVISATGTQSRGFNRLSTLSVAVRKNNEKDWFEVKYSGYGLRAPWLYTCEDVTLARAFRELQNHFIHKASTYRGAARTIEAARVKA